MEITLQEFRIAQEEVTEGTSAYAKWHNIHPTDPHRGTRIPTYGRGYEESLATHYSIEYVRTQPEYVLHQLPWEHVMGEFGLPRTLLSPLRKLGADGDTLNLSVADYYQHNPLLIQIDDVVTTQPLRNWARIRFEKCFIPANSACDPPFTIAKHPRAKAQLRRCAPQWKTWMALIDGDITDDAFQTHWQTLVQDGARSCDLAKLRYHREKRPGHADLSPHSRSSSESLDPPSLSRSSVSPTRYTEIIHTL